MTTLLYGPARQLALIAVMPILLAPPAGAQDVASSFEQLGDRVRPGETIYVTDLHGITSKGSLVSVSGSSLRLRLGGDPFTPIDLLERDVNNIVVKRFDPLWNGMLVGLAAGAAPVALIGAGASASGGEVAAVAGGYGLIGLLIGLAVDTFNRHEAMIYVGGARQRSARIGVSAGPAEGAGFQIALQF